MNALRRAGLANEGKRFGCFAATAVLAATLLAPGPAAAEKRLLYLLDSTGSMREEVGKERKLDMAKRVMRGLMGEIGASAPVGLIVFGNRKQSCEDIPIAVPLVTGGKDKLVAVVRDLEPMGTTPLAGSVRAAGAYLKRTNQPATIVLVTDGEEQCGDDPFEAAKSLKAQGLDVVLHIIGLAVTDTVRRQLEEMAHLGGGTFYNARTETELRHALRQAGAENFLRLSASVEQVVFSKVLYGLRADESLRVRFRPVQKVGGDGPHLILVDAGSHELELDDGPAGWELDVNHRPDSRAVLPKNLTISNTDWNTCRVAKTASGIEVFINDVSVAHFDDDEESSPVKVGVRGFDVDVAGVTVDLQPF